MHLAGVYPVVDRLRRREPRNSPPFKTLHLTVNLNAVLRSTINPWSLPSGCPCPNFRQKSGRNQGPSVTPTGNFRVPAATAITSFFLALISDDNAVENHGTREKTPLITVKCKALSLLF